MKILYHHRIRSKDGQYVHVEELIAAFERLGHEIRVVGPSRLNKEEFGSESTFLSWARQRIPMWIYELMEFGYSFLDYCRLMLAVFQFRPDVIYERFNLFFPSGIWVSRLTGIPLFLEVNAPLFEERQANSGIALTGLARWSQSYVWTGATKCLPVSNVLANYLRRTGVDDDRIAVVPNGINEEKFLGNANPVVATEALPATWENSIVMGFVGFVRSWHGLEKVIELLADKDVAALRVTLLVVGDGPARADLELLAARLEIRDKVLFTGLVFRDEIQSYVRLFDIALQPSVVKYASPLKIFEYMALRRAIIAPSVPNIREILTNEKDALLFEETDQQSLKEAVLRLGADPSLRSELGKAAYKTLTARDYTWSGNARRITSMFGDAIAWQR